MRSKILLLLANILMIASLVSVTILGQLIIRTNSGAIRNIPATVRVYTLGIAGSHRKHFGLSTSQIDVLSEDGDHALGVGGGLVGHVVVNTSASNSSHAAQAMLIAGKYFQALHARAYIGRLITLQQVRSAEPVAVISEAFADELYQTTSRALGQVISVSLAHVGIPVSIHIIGVLPSVTPRVGAKDIQLWLPHGVYATLAGQKASSSGQQGLNIAGMPAFITVPANYSRARIKTELTRLTQQFQAAYSLSPNQRFITTYPYSKVPQQFKLLLARLRLYLLVAALATLFTIVNAWAVAWLMAKRNALNQGMLRILGMTHRALLSTSAAKTGRSFLALVIVAALLVMVALVALRPWLVELGIASSELRSMAWRIFAWVVPGLLVVTVLQSFPELYYGWREPAATGSTHNLTGLRGVGGLLFSVETFFVAILSISAAWSGILYYQQTHTNLGFLKNPSTIVHIGLHRGYGELSMMMLPPKVLYESNKLILDALNGAIKHINPHARTGIGPEPGEKDASFQSFARHQSNQMQVCDSYISPGWLQAAQTTILAGQGFSRRSPDFKTVLIDVVIARHFFVTSASAVGRWLEVQTPLGELQSLRVKGVLRSIKLGGDGKSSCPTVYFNLRNHGTGAILGGYGNLFIYPKIKTTLQPTLRAIINRALLRVTPMLQVKGFTNSGVLISALNAPQLRLATILFSVAAFTWLVALFGLVVMLRLQYNMQKRLLAIRSALGAGPSRLYREVVLGVLALVGAGMGLALLAAPWLATQFTFLSGSQVSPFGLPTWIALAVLLLAVLLVAHFPARRAARAAPAESLHEL